MMELETGLSRYWDTAASILEPGGVVLKPPGKNYLSMEKNFFSLLFLYSFFRAGITGPRRLLYAAALQCLRGMVTGCDNILDDEYKKTLDTDIPESGYRFRSVVDIMVSDRVLFEILLDACRRGEITMDQVLSANRISMKTMTRSGVQEASEESGITAILKPDELLHTIHHYKTGLLFQCPWDIPRAVETLDETVTGPLLEGLYRIGMGCQVMDDMVDLVSDLERKRHNYVAALIHHDAPQAEKNRLRALLGKGGPPLSALDLAGDFPVASARAGETAQRFLKSGLNALFSEEHRFLVAPTIQFLVQRIGAPLQPAAGGP
jgi:hypothetical protein